MAQGRDVFFAKIVTGLKFRVIGAASKRCVLVGLRFWVCALIANGITYESIPEQFNPSTVHGAQHLAHLRKPVLHVRIGHFLHGRRIALRVRMGLHPCQK